MTPSKKGFLGKNTPASLEERQDENFRKNLLVHPEAQVVLGLYYLLLDNPTMKMIYK